MITRRAAVGSQVAMMFVKLFSPYGVLSVKESSSTCHFAFFKVETMYCRTIVLFSLPAGPRRHFRFDVRQSIMVPGTRSPGRGIRILDK